MPEAGEAERPSGGAGLVAAGVVLAAAIVLFGIANERVVAWIIHPALPMGL